MMIMKAFSNPVMTLLSNFPSILHEHRIAALCTSLLLSVVQPSAGEEAIEVSFSFGAGVEEGATANVAGVSVSPSPKIAVQSPDGTSTPCVPSEKVASYYTAKLKMNTPYMVTITVPELEETGWDMEVEEWIDVNGNCIEDPDDEITYTGRLFATRGHSWGRVTFVGCTQPKISPWVGNPQPGQNDGRSVDDSISANTTLFFSGREKEEMELIFTGNPAEDNYEWFVAGPTGDYDELFDDWMQDSSPLGNTATFQIILTADCVGDECELNPGELTQADDCGCADTDESGVRKASRPAAADRSTRRIHTDWRGLHFRWQISWPTPFQR